MTVITTSPSLREAIAHLVALRDPEGILSLYADVGAERERRHRPRAAEVALRNGLERLRSSLIEQALHDRARVVDARLREMAAALEDLVDPARPGRGRALVVQLSGGPPYEVVTACAMGDLVDLGATACAAPLLAPLAGADPAGLVSLGAEDLRLIEIRADGAEQVMRVEYGIPSEDWRPMVGPVSPTPGRGRESEVQRDLFARRLEAHRDQRIRRIGADVWREARRRGWSRLVASGSGERVRALQATRPAAGPALLVTDARLSDEATPETLRAAVVDQLADARLRAGRELAESLRDAALSASGRAVVGLDDTLGALAEGRVDQLVVDAGARPVGARTPSGRLAAVGEVPPGADAADVVPEPHLVERMIERAFATDATLVAVEGRAAEPLAPYGGVAARLRW